jgi:alpha-tubulin suppressor-like RCC1 family protein
MEGGVPDAEPDAPDDASVVDTGVDAGPVTAVALYSGFDIACAIGSDKQLYCWGDNLHQQIAANNLSAVTPTVVNLQQKPLSHMAIGGGHICVSSGTNVTCWGQNDKGQTISGSPSGDLPVSSPKTFQMLNQQSIDALVAGSTFTCALAGGETYCWGLLGIDTFDFNQGSLSSSHKVLSAGDNHACAVTVNGSMECWGNNNKGQLTYDPNTPNISKPQPTKYQFTGATGVSCGFAHSAAVDVNGSWIWGDNGHNEINVSQIAFLYVPTKFIGGDVVFGAGHVCALTKGSIHCRGDNTVGQVGPSMMADMTGLMPVPLPNNDMPIAIAAGGTHSCALGSSGTIYCWGGKPVAPSTAKPTPIVLK